LAVSIWNTTWKKTNGYLHFGLRGFLRREYCRSNEPGQFKLGHVHISCSHRVVHDHSKASGNLVAMHNRLRFSNVNNLNREKTGTNTNPMFFPCNGAKAEISENAAVFFTYNTAGGLAVSRGSSPAANSHADGKHGKSNKQTHTPCCVKVSRRWGVPTGCPMCHGVG
jgi:hypothetical protein